MLDNYKAFDLLRRIGDLWAQLGRTTVDSLEYHSILQEIQALSEEHQSLIEAAKNPR